MFECGKYNLVHDFFKKVQKSSIPNALNYKGKYTKHFSSPFMWRNLFIPLFIYYVNDSMFVYSSCEYSLEGRKNR